MNILNFIKNLFISKKERRRRADNIKRIAHAKRLAELIKQINKNSNSHINREGE